MTALRARILLLAFATGALLGQSWTAHATIEQDRLDICVLLRNNVSLSDIEQELELTGFSAAAAGRYTGEQVKLYCPDMYVALAGQVSHD